MSEQLIIGFGFRQAACLASFESAMQKLSTFHHIDGIAVPEDKVEHAALRGFAKKVILPVFGVDKNALSQIQTPTQSAKILSMRNTGSVAEAAALAIFKSTARLVATRCISEDRLAVCAIAKGIIL